MKMKRYIVPIAVPLASFLLGVVATVMTVSAILEPRPDIHWAVSQNDPDAIKRYIAAGADPSGANVRGVTPMHLAASYGFYECAKALIEGGARVGLADGYGDTPLHHVCRDDYMTELEKEKMIKFLLAHGAEVDARNLRGQAPLHVACNVYGANSREGGAGAAALLKGGADPNARNDLGRPPVFIAVDSGRVKELELLVAYGADLTIVDNDGKTVLDFVDAGHMARRLAELMAEQGNGQE